MDNRESNVTHLFPPSLPETVGISVRRYQLTTREQDVMPHLLLGRSNAEIAEELGIRLSTVKSHVSAILQKVRVESREQLCGNLFGWHISDRLH